MQDKPTDDTLAESPSPYDQGPSAGGPFQTSWPFLTLALQAMSQPHGGGSNPNSPVLAKLPSPGKVAGGTTYPPDPITLSLSPSGSWKGLGS